MSMAQLVVTAVLVEGRTKTEVARTYGVSRRWVITLVARFLAEGEAGLVPRSRRPHESPGRTPQSVEDEIVALRKDLDRDGHDAGAAVAGLCELLHGHDALDVMAMLTQYLAPPDLAMRSESTSALEDSWACAEVVALALLGDGLPQRTPDRAVRTASIVPDVVHRAAVIVMLSTFSTLNKLALQSFLTPDDAGPGHLAWLMQSHETSVRGRQYVRAATQINESILRHSRAETAWRSTLGYTYDDVLAVRRSLVEICGTAHDEALDDRRLPGGPR